MQKLAAIAERAVQICATLAIFTFFVSGVAYMYLGRWKVTHTDYWAIYDICLNHTWLESALLKFNNHSLFFPSFLWLANLRFFHGDQQPLFFAGLTLLSITALLLLIPVWRDKTVSMTAKIMATLVVIVGNFWMGRATIIASGGYNCINSSVMVATALAFLLLPMMSDNAPRVLPTALIVISAGFVASFSFATGLAIWPTVLCLGWCLRLPRYSVLLLALAGITAAVLFVLLPPHGLNLQPAYWSLPSVAYTTVIWLCRLIGSPFSYAVFAWGPDKFYRHLIESSGLALWSGAIGLALAALAVLPQIIRRNIQKSTLQFTGLALVIFNIFALLLVTAGRSAREPFSLSVAPRYLFWSTLFWTGLFLVAIQRAESRRWLRWPIYLAALALPVLFFPKHYKEGLSRRRVMSQAGAGAVSLVNGVRDEQITRILFYNPKKMYRVAEELRARRLDMFADGLQDWIGHDEVSLFAGRHKPRGLKGQCSVVALTQGDKGAPAARVLGQAWEEGNSIPNILVIVDPTGVIRGVARSSMTSPFINRVFYLGKSPPDGFLGYIRDYDPQLQYAVRSADDGILSEEAIAVQIPPTEPAKP